MKKISNKTLTRLILYKNILLKLPEKINKLYSYELAKLSGNTAAQVRRDLMVVGYYGSPANGYNVNELSKSISAFIDNEEEKRVVLIGIGHLGIAILDYFHYRNPKMTIVAAFDKDFSKVNRVFHGYTTYHIDYLKEFVKSSQIDIAIICVPAEEAPKIAELLNETEIKGVLNFSPVHLHLDNAVVENQDLMLSLEKIAFLVNT